MEVSVSIIRHTLEILLTEIYPDVSELDKGYYTLDDILNQLTFEIIKEDYKANSKKHNIQYYADYGRRIAKAFSELSENQRALLKALYEDGMTETEHALRLGISQAAVARRLDRIRRKLEKALK